MNAAPKTLRTLSDLGEAGLTTDEQRAALERVAAQYAVAITPVMSELIDRNEANDPIAKQFVPDTGELRITPEESPDPIGDHPHSPVEGVVHRYPDRVLLKLTPVCAVYCRFCFRREMIERSGDAHAGDKISDQELLREVMNTVGKFGQLGGSIRCVVSVSMLTEGWDANTVTHVLGIRAFEHDLAARHGGGDGIGAGLDAIRDDAVGGAVQPLHAFDAERRGADAFDLRAHGDEAARDIADLGLAEIGRAHV